MKIRFNDYKKPEIPLIHLATPDKKIICTLNGVQSDSASLKPRLNNTFELSFTLDRYLDVEGTLVETNGYDLLNEFMRLKIDGVGWFILSSSPTVDNDGKTEKKTVTAVSAEIELSYHDLVGFKVNCGTTDSYEMLVDGNVVVIDGVEFAKKQIVFCDKENPELSLVHIVLKASEITGWTIGHVDTVPKKQSIYKDGKIEEVLKQLKDEIGTFDISSQGAYSFFTQDIAQYFECICLFDFNKFEINFYRAENLGKDTNINIGFRNLQNSNSITVDENSIYTRYRVAGGNGLGIEYVNFGNSIIEDLSYYLTTKYMPIELINKYKEWVSYVDSVRPKYIEATRLYNTELNVKSELQDRVPLDDCSTDWYKMSIDELEEAQKMYQAQQKGYESFYVDEDGNFDQAALDASVDANDYYQIKDVIIPNIDIAIKNKEAVDKDDKIDPIDSYLTNWKLYGLDELLAKLDTYKDRKEFLEKNKYSKPYTEESGHTKDLHEKYYQEYVETCVQMDETLTGTCAYVCAERKAEIEVSDKKLSTYDTTRKEVQKNVQKENWAVDGTKQFTVAELNTLAKLYIDTDYVNENMFLVSADDQITAIDEQLRLFDAAKTDLESTSQPQFTYSTTLDNFLANYDYKDYTEALDLGDFVYLGVRDDYVVKLRAISIAYNPFFIDNSLTIEFSNMVKNRSKRNDLANLLVLNGKSGKNQISGSSNNSQKNDGITITAGLLEKILASTAFGNEVSNIINQSFGSLVGGFIDVKGLNAEMIRVTDIYGENGFFEYLQAKLISADKIVADSGIFGELKAYVANIDNLLAGNISAELGHIINLTAKNVTIDEAVIREIIAAQMTIGMIQAGDISTNRFHILSDDGGIDIIGNTMQFKDANNVVRIQIGRDTADNFTFCLYDETGEGVLIDSTGIKKSAISDGLITTDMIGNGAVTESKIDKTNILQWTDENGDEIFDVAKMKYNNEEFSVSYESTVHKVDSNSEAINAIDIGSRNLLLKSNIAYDNKSYLVASYYFGNSKPIEGVPHVITIKGTVSDGQKFVIYNSGEYVQIGACKKLENNIHKLVIPSWVIKTVSTTSTNTHINVYSYPNSNGTKSSTIEWIKLEKGNKATDWTPAPEDIESKFETMTTTISGVSTKVDAVEKSITDKVWQRDIDTVVDNYDKTVTETLRDRVTEVETDVTGVTTRVEDVETYVGTDEDESNTKTLTEKIAEVKVSADGIRQTVETNYAKNSDLEGAIAESSSSVLNQTANMIDTAVKDNITGEKSYVNQKAGEITSVIGQDLFEPINVRYIRDWLFSNDKDEQNRFVECKVFDKENTNVAIGKVPTAYTEDLTPITSISNLATYTDNSIDNKIFITADNLAVLKIDLGKVYEDVDAIQIFHYFADKRICAHKLEISEDGTNWITIYDTTLNGTYAETENGLYTKVQTQTISQQISFIKQTISSYSIMIKKNEDNYAELEIGMNSIIERVTTAENDIKSTVEEIKDANGWKVKMAKIGAYDGTDIEPVWSAMTLNEYGLEVSSGQKKGHKTKIKADSFTGTYNEGLADSVDEVIFGIDKDLVYAKRLKAEKGIDFINGKLLPINYNGHKGIALIKASGEA